jgi:hypothetical protein
MIRDGQFISAGLLEDTRWRWRQSLPTRIASGKPSPSVNGFSSPILRTRPRRHVTSPQPLHLLETHRTATGDDHLRRAGSREMHRPGASSRIPSRRPSCFSMTSPSSKPPEPLPNA